MGIFISYRRNDLNGNAVAFVKNLRDVLASEFEQTPVFLDSDCIAYGRDFLKEISQGLNRSNVVLAVIGKQWASELMQRWHDDEMDYVRLELEIALDRMIQIVPVLVDGAQMPTKKELPDTIRQFSMQNGPNVQSHSIASDPGIQKLIERLRFDHFGECRVRIDPRTPVSGSGLSTFKIGILCRRSRHYTPGQVARVAEVLRKKAGGVETPGEISVRGDFDILIFPPHELRGADHWVVTPGNKPGEVSPADLDEVAFLLRNQRLSVSVRE